MPVKKSSVPVASSKGDELNSLLKSGIESAMPSNIKPMKATLVGEPFDEAGWIYEVKWDGYRALAYTRGQQADLISRNNIPFDQFSVVNKALAALNINAVLDGEVVVMSKKGVSDFGALQNWKNNSKGELAYYVFDILWYEGVNLTKLPLHQRRKILSLVLPADNEVIRLSPSFETSGIDFFQAAEKMQLEGIIAKKAESLYTSNLRSKEWLKIKVQRRQEVVIAGYTKNAGTSEPFSALAIGVYDKRGILRYIGKVGTGFSNRVQKEMMELFKPLETDTCPFDIEPDVDEPSRFRPQRLGAKPTWLKPELVCEINFAEITSDQKVRHASFKGMRTDKAAREVVLELEQDTESIIHENDNAASTTAGTVPAPSDLLLTAEEDIQTATVDGHLLKFTNLHKLYWPEDNVTKRDMFNYYYQVAPYMMPYLKDRPMSLNRFPNGIHGDSFYQKNVKTSAPEWAKTMPHPTSEGELKDYLVATGADSLLWMASLGCIEMNPWFSRAQSPDNPDYCVIDLDPDKNTFEQVIEAALIVRDVLQAIGVPSYPKTSGSTGIHIYIPLGAKYSYDQSQMFAKYIVTIVHNQIPEYTSLERMVRNRSGKMYLDFLQNRPGATIAAPYSLRPKPGATVSMPVSWDEVKPGLTMRAFTIKNSLDRLKETGDLFTGVLAEGIDMADCLMKAKTVF